MMRKGVVVAAWLAVAVAMLAAQDPDAEQERTKSILKMLDESPRNPVLMYEMAKTEALAGNATSAREWVERALKTGIWLDLESEVAFDAMRQTPWYAELSGRAAGPTVSTSSVHVKVPIKDLLPEGIAYDLADQSVYLGSVFQPRIVRVDRQGKTSDFVTSGQTSIWSLLGMRVDSDGHVLWACAAAGPEKGDAQGSSAILGFRLDTGDLAVKALLDTSNGVHFLNDLALTPDGTVYATDTEAGAIYRLRAGEETIEPFLPPGSLQYPNGITLSGDKKSLYVADFRHGISIVDIATGASRALSFPDDVCPFGIDGLYWHETGLVAVQNSAGLERIVRYKLNSTGSALESLTVLESRNPLFYIPTTGAIAGDDFVYIANSHVDSIDVKGELKPDRKIQEEVVLLRLPLRR